jgi:hypothetical protein
VKSKKARRGLQERQLAACRPTGLETSEGSVQYPIVPRPQTSNPGATSDGRKAAAEPAMQHIATGGRGTHPIRAPRSVCDGALPKNGV